MDKALLEATAATLVAPGKGILAADESNGTMSKRLEGVGIESSEEARRAYRANLFATLGCEDAISGVILYDETIRQSMDDGTSIPDYLNSRGILPGIKVDTGTIDLEGCPGEKLTKGIEAEPENGWADLGTRCAEYFAMGARFAKWRAVIKIENPKMSFESLKRDWGSITEPGMITKFISVPTSFNPHSGRKIDWEKIRQMWSGLPSIDCLISNGDALAQYAIICQENGLVPIIEPEVLMDGPHSISDCQMVTMMALSTTWAACNKQGVHLPGVLLKPNMTISGKDATDKSSRDEVANATVSCLTKSVPHNVGGIVFLSGGQSDEEATDHLNRMNGMDVEHPWQLSYSYGRALQAAALKAWAEEGAEASQAAFAHRAKMNSLARSGDWDITLE
ncbi:MAG: fructose-bisphosphate aldolase [Candidatus Thermoplasmatota archaeon]|nr:fructose-bisphosphate aldolase [Candidatus Thermoplasmatota archaeon]